VVEKNKEVEVRVVIFGTRLRVVRLHVMGSRRECEVRKNTEDIRILDKALDGISSDLIIGN
jgi:hypothetical protein